MLACGNGLIGFYARLGYAGFGATRQLGSGPGAVSLVLNGPRTL